MGCTNWLPHNAKEGDKSRAANPPPPSAPSVPAPSAPAPAAPPGKEEEDEDEDVDEAPPAQIMISYRVNDTGGLAKGGDGSAVRIAECLQARL